MFQPEEPKVHKLRKSLYGLKQALKQWYEKFNDTMIQYDFIMNTPDSCMYLKLVGSDCVIICLYGDDMLIFSANVHVVDQRKSYFLI